MSSVSVNLVVYLCSDLSIALQLKVAILDLVFCLKTSNSTDLGAYAVGHLLCSKSVLRGSRSMFYINLSCVRIYGQTSLYPSMVKPIGSILQLILCIHKYPARLLL